MSKKPKRPKRPKKKSKIELRNEAAREYLLGEETPNLEDARTGELLEICRHVGLSAHRGMGREALVEVLEGEGDPERSQVDVVRDKLGVFVRMYWERIEQQIESMEGCTGDCYGCSDAKTVACFLENAENLFT